MALSTVGNQFGIITFGAGTAILTPTVNGPTLPTPINLPIMQELSIDISGDIAELYGQGSFPYGVARTKTKITCKAKIGAIYAHLLSDLFFGTNVAVGQTLFVNPESCTVTSLTCTVANAAHFVKDLGVVNAATGAVYTDVGAGSLTAIGQYKATSGGVYTFFTGDTIATALITYSYSSSSTGQSSTILNVAMGQMPQFDFVYMNNQFGQNVYLEFFRAVATKISLPNKNTEFDMMDFDFSCFSLSNGQVFLLSLDE
jgi:hypothetical protein